jgi:hypothetical protein
MRRIDHGDKFAFSYSPLSDLLLLHQCSMHEMYRVRITEQYHPYTSYNNFCRRKAEQIQMLL